MSRRLGRDERGQSLVEFALVVPLLLLLVIGIMEFGRAYSTSLTLQNATREGARLAITGATDSAITQRVANSAVGVDSTKLTVTVSPATRVQGTYVTVSSQYKYQYITPLLTNIVGSLRTLKSTVTMRVE